MKTSEQEAYIITQGCYEGRGYLYSRPLPAKELTQRLTQTTNTEQP